MGNEELGCATHDVEHGLNDGDRPETGDVDRSQKKRTRAVHWESQ
jgi:hypothetical protein